MDEDAPGTLPASDAGLVDEADAGEGLRDRGVTDAPEVPDAFGAGPGAMPAEPQEFEAPDQRAVERRAAREEGEE